jgi:hypothetical protein
MNPSLAPFAWGFIGNSLSIGELLAILWILDEQQPPHLFSPTIRTADERIASYAMQRAGAMVFVNLMRIPCFGRRMTIGRASIVWPGAN